jgi:hypothetical protein
MLITEKSSNIQDKSRQVTPEQSLVNVDVAIQTYDILKVSQGQQVSKLAAPRDLTLSK